MVPQDSNIDPLARAILAQAESEAKKIKQAAEVTAQQLVAEAEREAGKQREAALLVQADRTKRESASTLAAARLETRQRILEAREELIDRVFAKVEERFEGLRKDPAYRRILVDLVREGAAALEGENFIVAVTTDDYDLASQALRSMPLEGKQIEVRPDEQVHGGGCIIWQSDRRSFYDNTFDSIIARHRSRLRMLVAEILWGKETRWDEI
jgi:vacuolar-type H+-ATPase subunit E/Vma4